jgi:alpha-L-rhamnosidase
LYGQWLVDIQDDQRSDGSVPDVCPAYWPLYQDGTVWASSYIIIPHMLYDQYGDLGILQKHYDSMKKWTDYMTRFLENGIMPRNTYADWCFPPQSLTEMTVIPPTPS